MANLNIVCPKCKTDNPIDIFKAEEGSRILCRKCNTFITLTFVNGKTPKKVKEEIVQEIRKSLPKNIKIRI